MPTVNQDMILEYYKQLSVETCRTLLHIQETVPYPKKANKRSFARRLFSKYPEFYKSEKEAMKAVRDTWRTIKFQTLTMNEKTLSQMILSKQRYYSGNLRKALKLWYPELNKVQIRRLEEEILNSIENDIGLS